MCYFSKVFDIVCINSHLVNGHRNLIIGLYVLTSDHRFDCEKDIEENKQPHFSMNLKRAPMYSKMVEDMLQMTKIQHEATLECKIMFFDQPHILEIHQEMYFKEKMV